MIPDIREVYFPKDENGKQYATLTSAQVSKSDMGDKVITATIKIDGSIIPDFSQDWVVEFQGERYIHPLREPQAKKENEDIRSSIDLTFRHWAIVELQRYFFVEMASIGAGKAIPNKFNASITLTLPDFITALNLVLAYWYGDKIRAELWGDWVASDIPTTISISYTHIWDLLTSEEFYKAYGCRWQMVSDPQDNDKAIIKFGFPTTEINHIFKYGFEGGLLKVERQVQSDDIRNVLYGRGGEKNVPYRYFKRLDDDNPSFPQDPDWVHELASIPFDRIRDAAFRSYVQGWKYSHWDEYESLEPKYQGQRVPRENAYVDWAWFKGATDAKFDPVEYVKDDESIAKYGERLGALDDDDETYPTIQGITIDGIGRVDQVVDVGEVVPDEDAAESSNNDAEIAKTPSIKGTTKITKFTDTFKDYVKIEIPVEFFNGKRGALSASGSTLTVPEGHVANYLIGAPTIVAKARTVRPYIGVTEIEEIVDVSIDCVFKGTTVVFENVLTRETSSPTGLAPGTYSAKLTCEVEYDISEIKNRNYLRSLEITASYPPADLQNATAKTSATKKYANTFDIWVKNIWNTTHIPSESLIEYAERVWRPILGDREGNEARVVFSTGLLSVAQDYEFAIVGTPVADRSKTFEVKDKQGNVVEKYSSEWRITLGCSEADFDTLGVLIPNLQTRAYAGDYFYFIGIDLPYLYYTEAEKRVTAHKQDELGNVANINPTWVVSLDKVRCGRKQFDDIAPLLSQIEPGASFRLTDPRFLQSVETFVVQSVTYNYNEPTKDDPFIVPDVEIVLSDKYSTSSNPIGMIQSQVDVLQRQVGSISNIQQIMRIVGDRLYLRKDGIADLSYSPTRFNSLVTSNDFRAGSVGGAGWGFYRDANGNAVLEVDRAIFRQDLEVNNLVINQVKSQSGMIVESSADMEVSLVVDNEDGYYCYFDQKQGSVGNLFQENDIAYCNRWDEVNLEEKFYKRRVKAVGNDYIVLTKGDAEGENPKNDTGVNGRGIPEQKDIIVHFGNYDNPNRQFVIVRNVIGGGYESFLGGLDSVNADGEEYYFVGRRQNDEPRFFLGDPERFFEWTKKGGLYVKGRIVSSLSGKELDDAVLSSTYYYTQTDSDKDAPELPTVGNYGDWSENLPTEEDGKFIWQTTQTTLLGGTVSFSTPICITPRKGENAYTLDLTREMAAVPCNAEGNPLSKEPVVFKAQVYSGVNEAKGFTFSAKGDGVSAKMSSDYEIEADPTTMTSETAEVTVYATNGVINLETVFTLYKILPGVDGVTPDVFIVQSTADVIVRSMDGKTTPSQISFKKYVIAEDGYNETDKNYLYAKREGTDNDYLLIARDGIGEGVVNIENTTTAIDVQLRNNRLGSSSITLDRLHIPVLADSAGMKIGGVNLLRYTNMGVRGWGAYHDANVPFHIESDGNSGAVVLVNDTDVLPESGKDWQMVQFAIPTGVLKKGVNYILSFNIHPSLGVPKMGVSIAKNTSGGFVALLSHEIYLDGLYQMPFMIANDAEYDETTPVWIEFWFDGAYIGGKDRWERVAIWDLMLEEGNVPTGYQPSPLDVNYLKKALQEDGSLQGGLLLASLIRLGYTQADGEHRVMSGLNGIHDEGEGSGGIAFWAGGDMVDAEIDPTATDKATSVIRMDGTGYMAGNTIRFKESQVELGDNLVLSKTALTLSSETGEKVRFSNEGLPEDLADLVSQYEEISVTANATSMYIGYNGGLYTHGLSGYVLTNAAKLNDMSITSNVLGQIANLTIKVVFDGIPFFAENRHPRYITLNVQLSNSSETYTERFSLGEDNRTYEATIKIANVKFDVQTIVIATRVYVERPIWDDTQNYTQTSIKPYCTGVMQSLGDNMTLIGSDGLISSWKRTAMGVNQNMAIMRAGGYGVKVSLADGISLMWDNKWRRLSVDADGTLRLNP